MSRARLKRVLKAGPVVSPFLVLGDPTPSLSLELAKAAIDAGAGALEIGFPFGDPVADGPAIQRADARALSAADGTFSIPGTAAGWVDVHASRPGYLPWQEAVDPLLDQEIDVTLRRGALLRVRVVNPLRSPVPGARVCATDSAGLLPQTSHHARAHADAARPGTYRR